MAISLGIADALLILFVLAGAALATTHETLHTRYELKEMLPDRARRDPRQRQPLPFRADDRGRERALGRLPRRRCRPGEASLQLKHFILAAVAGSGIFVILLGLAAAALTGFLFILYVVRAPDPDPRRGRAADAPHVRAAPDGRARAPLVAGMTVALAVQVAQALVLATAGASSSPPAAGRRSASR